MNYELTTIGCHIISHKLAFLVLEVATDGDHGRVIGGQIQRREEDVAVVAACEVGHRVAQTAVRRDTAGQHQVFAVTLLESLLHFVGQRLHDGVLYTKDF